MIPVATSLVLIAVVTNIVALAATIVFVIPASSRDLVVVVVRLP